MAITSAAPVLPRPTAALLSRLSGSLGYVSAALARAHTRRALEGLNDDQLKDIGLTRTQIGGVSHDRRYGPHYTHIV